MSSATVTVREVKNKSTGIDLSIPTFKEIPGLLGATVEYHVVVVSRLHYFKSPKHKDSDNVQYMIVKHLDDFDDLRKKLGVKFPGTVLPPIPRKSLLMGESNIQQRKTNLENFLRHIASTPKLATCHVTLEFLGVNAIKAGKFRTDDAITVQDKDDLFEDKEEEKSSPGELFADMDDEEKDLFADASSKVLEEDPDLFSDSPLEPKSRVVRAVGDPLGVAYDSDELFTSTVTKQQSSDPTKLFEGQDLEGDITEDLLFVPGAKDLEPDKKKIQIEDNSALLDIEDDLDHLLHIRKDKNQSNSDSVPRKPGVYPGKPALKPKPQQGKPTLAPKPGQKPQKPPKPSQKPSPGGKTAEKSKKSDSDDLFSRKTDSTSSGPFGADDILKYIEDNTTRADDDLDLFS